MKRKSNRLKLGNYKTLHIYYLTLNCNERNRYFTDGRFIEDCLNELKKLTEKFHSKIWAYCFMPDHLHLLLETEGCLKFMKSFKQITGYSFRQQGGQNLWQKSFYDHVLRKEEDLLGTIKYILNNSVRIGLVEDYLDYPFSGSFEIDIKDFVET